MTALLLTTSQRKAHRAAAHHLDPVVAIGADGLSPAVVHEADVALNAHGLVKVRVASEDRAQRESWLAQLADTLAAAPVQHIGKLLVLWRPIPLKELSEPAEHQPGPKIVKLVKFSKSGNHRPQIKKVKVLGNQRVTSGGLIKRAKKARLKSAKKAAEA